MRKIELFEIVGKAVLDNKEALEQLDKLLNKGQQTQSKLSKFLGGIGNVALKTGKIIGVGLAAGGTAMAGLTVKALNLSGELEQNMGGSEAVFGKFAGKMQETAKEAFSNMGLSTSDYLATANKMGALFQGAGFDIEESMNLSQDAMQRAADVASIMGLDTSAAMEAVAGAAKGNFTMMDNLGVAMNETTLANYALEKGMKKSYKEMTQQEKIGVAMEMFLDKTAYAAGNYAKENETLAGSLGTAKAALTNFLDGSGDVDSLVNAFENAANVIIDNIKTIAPRLVTGITDIINQVIPKIPSLLNELLPAIVEGAVSLVNGLVAALPGILDALMAILPTLVEGLGQIITGLIEALPKLLQSLIEGIVGVLPTLLPLLIDAVIGLVVSIFSNISDLLQPIIDALPDIIIKIVEALMNNLPALIEGCIALVLGIVEAIPQIIQGLVDALPTVVSLVVEGLIKAIPQLIVGLIQVIGGVCKAIPQIWKSFKEGTVNVFKGLWDGIKKVFAPLVDWFGDVFKKGKEKAVKAWESVKKFFKDTWDAIKKVFSNVGSWFSEQFTKAKDGLKNAWSSVKNFFSNIWSGIKNVFASVGSWFKNIFTKAKEGIQSAWASVKNFFSNIWSGIKTTFSNIGGWFKDKFNAAKNGVQNAWSGVKNFFSKIKDGIVTAFSNVKEKLLSPFKRARDEIKKVADKIKGFFKGEITMPKLKLPKFSIKPAGWKIGDLLKGEIPKLGITWAAKGGIFDEPTLFNTPTGALGVGEAGAEAVAPIDVLMGYVKTAVKSETNGIAERMDDIINMLAKFFTRLFEENGKPIVIDRKSLVDGLAPQMNAKLAEIQNANARGR